MAFGPVADPAGFWGVAIVAADSLDDARALRGDDPAVSSSLAT